MEFGQRVAAREAYLRETSDSAPTSRRGVHQALVRALELRAETALLRLDAEMVLAGETASAQRGPRLLTILAQALGLDAVAFLPARPGRAVVATDRLSSEVIDRLCPQPASARVVDDPVRVSIEDGRVRLLARGTTHPLLGGLREIHGWIEALAVLPLRRLGSEGALLLFSADAELLRPELLAGLGGVAHCVALLLSAPSESASECRDESAPGGEAERAWVEVEELRHRLREAAERETTERGAFQLGERELQAEHDTMQLRLTQFEVECVASAERVRALEAERDALATECAAVAARCAGLELALDAASETAGSDALVRVAASVSALPECSAGRSSASPEASATTGLAGSLDVEEAAAEPAVFELPLTGDEIEVDVLALEVTEACDPVDENIDLTFSLTDGVVPPADPLDVVSGAIDLASSLADGVESTYDEVASMFPLPDGSAEAAGGRELAGVTRDAATPQACHRPLVLVEQSGVLRERAAHFADDRGLELWQDEVPLPPGAEALLIANLFDRDLAPTLARVVGGRRRHRAFAYAHDPEADAGCVLGPVDWLARPLQPEAAESVLAAGGATRGGSALVVSSQMRELVGVREALLRLDTAGSVAFDARQAVDLLDIIRRPCVLVVDLAPDPTRGLALVLELRRDERVASTPMVLLLPEHFDPDRLRREALRGGLLAPASSAAIERLMDVATRDAA